METARYEDPRMKLPASEAGFPGFTPSPPSEAYRIALITSAATLAAHRPNVSVQDLIAYLHNGVEQAIAPPAPSAPAAQPKVTARQSIRPDSVVCMCCGDVFKSLKRHLRTVHDLSPEEYREKWNLPDSHAIVAPNYAAVRSRLAKENGLGRKGA